MRSALSEILAYNRPFLKRSFGVESLHRKLENLTSSPFAFMRGTFHLFANDVTTGPFRKWRVANETGRIVGDLHTENFGSFRAISGDIIYDINDFDETTTGAYDSDLRRLATSIVLAGLDSGLRFGEGVESAGEMLQSYLETLVRMGRAKDRRQFASMEDSNSLKKLLSVASEKSRVEFLRPMVVESSRGSFVFRPSEKIRPLSEAQRDRVEKAVPAFLKNCITPPGAKLQRYRFHDAAFRFAGCGSLGRERYSVLVGKGLDKYDAIDSLRLVEFKDSLDSALDSNVPHAKRRRAEDIMKSTAAFQLTPKRYLGFTSIGGDPVQVRELGANDARFPHKQFKNADRFRAASAIFGQLTARAHLLGSLGEEGPRTIPHEFSGRTDRFINRILAFAAAYVEQIVIDHDDLRAARDRVASEWRPQGKLAACAD
jgi:uncharacterized protein (DUF2252 family)